MNFKTFSLIILASVASAIAQNNQGGTLVTAPIRPFAVQDTFPTAWANEVKGGPFTSTNLAGLSNIPTSRLEIGSLGYAQDTGLFHRLTSTSPVTWSSIDGSNFTNLPISATNISGVLSIESGGTGATNAATARTNLGLGSTNRVTFGPATLSKLNFSDSSIDIGAASSTTVDLTYIGVPLLSVDLSGVSFGSTSFAAVTRTNLGLGATWLTNTNVTNFRTAIGLGATNNVTFSGIIVDDLSISGSGYSGFGAFLDMEERALRADGLNVFSFYAQIMDMFVPITFNNTNIAATTRTNLGLGATWLTNSESPLFWTNVPASPTNSGTAGQVAYTNNYLYICISNNTWRRVQLGTW